MVEAGGDDLMVKPITMRDLQVRVRALLRLKELRGDLRSTQESLRELVKKENPSESKAPFDDRVAVTAQALARLIGLDAEDQEVAFHAGLLHDIGQIGLQSLAGLVAVHHGHLDIHQDQVRLEPPRNPDRLFPVVGGLGPETKV